MKVIKKLSLFLFFLIGINYLLNSQILIPQNSKLLKTIVNSRNSYAEILSDDWQRSFDEVEWTNVALPNSFYNVDKIIYKKSHKLKVQNYNDYVWHLYFLGIEDEIDIEINGVFIGRFFGAMTPFSVKLPSKYITNPIIDIKLTITASQSFSKIIREQNFCHPRNYTGVLREIILIGSPNIWVSNVINKVKYNSSNKNFIVNSSVNISSEDIRKYLNLVQKDSIRRTSLNSVNIYVENFIRSKEASINIASTNPQQVFIGAERSVNLNFLFQLSNVNLWNFSNPYEYENVVRISLNGNVIDEYVCPLGFYSFEKINNKFYFNGEPFDVKGVIYVEDHYLYAQSLSIEQFEQDIQSIKMLGANTIIFKYKIPHPYLIDLCNKNGLLAFIELPINNVPSKILISDEILVRMRNIADRLITYYASQTSVASWGIFAGIQDNKKDINLFLSSISEVFKKSSNKFVYKSISLNEYDIDINNCDFLVLSSEKQPQNFNNIKTLITRHRDLTHKIPVIFSFGFPVQPQNHNGFSDLLSLQAQSYIIENTYQLLNELLISGNFVYAYNDYELQNPILITNLQDKYLCTWGITDRSRNNRVSYSTLKAMFNKEKSPLLDAGNYISDTPNTFIFIGLFLCLVLLYLINRFRRFREYLVRSILRPYNFYADIRDQRIISTVQSFILSFVIATTLSIYIVSILYFYRDNFIVQIFTSLLIQNNSLREVLYSAIWEPELFMLMMTIIFMIKLFVIAFILKLFSYLIRPKIFYTDTFIITIWSGVPILILLPVAIILNKLLLISPNLTLWMILLLIAVMVWVLFRIIKAVSVVFDVRKSRTFLIGFAFILIIFSIFISIYQINFAIIDYTAYYFNYLFIN